MTDKNGLIYMRARYYSPVMKRFINADIIHGEISDSTSLNRYAYVNGNPVSFTDPFGLSILLTLGIMALCGFVVAALNAISSIAEQQRTSEEINWTKVAVDAAWGFVDGAISASPLLPVGKVVSDAIISFGKQITDVYFYSENKESCEWLKEVNAFKVTANVIADTVFSATDIPDMKQKKIAYQNLNVWENIKKREKRHSNKKVAQKRINEANKKIFDFCVPTILLNQPSCSTW